MVNNREVLKNSLEQRLGNNIHLAKQLLADLRGAIQQVESNSATAKGEVHQTVDSIQQLLVSRKLELTRQIDLLCRTQINSLQEEVQDTYIALGSLQSTLSNLESFDHNQLLNLNIHDLSLAKNFRAFTPLELNVNTTDLTNELEQWGSVNVKGLKGLIDVGTSASMPQRFVDYSDKKTEHELMFHKSVSSGPSSVVTFGRQPKLPCKSNIAVETSNSWENVNMEVLKDRITSEKCDVEQWLTAVKSQSGPELDDFELVSVENLSETEKDVIMSDDEKVLNSSDNDLLGCKAIEDGDSSIVCLEKEDAMNTDLSKWLKPKKNGEEQHISSVVTEVSPITVSVSKDYHNPMNNRFVDFPCLRVDHKYWVPSKKTKSSFYCPDSSDIAVTFSQKEIIPPTHALPTPFWLKKYR